MIFLKILLGFIGLLAGLESLGSWKLDVPHRILSAVIFFIAVATTIYILAI